jgi:hypothetical protein
MGSNQPVTGSAIEAGAAGKPDRASAMDQNVLRNIGQTWSEGKKASGAAASSNNRAVKMLMADLSSRAQTADLAGNPSPGLVFGTTISASCLVPPTRHCEPKHPEMSVRLHKVQRPVLFVFSP